MNNEKVFVVSLPRTGTTSMCKMLNVLGYKTKHVASGFYEKWVKDGFNAFADTPCFSLSFIKEQSIRNPENKFIYIERNVEEWIDSFEKIKLPKGYDFLMNMTCTDLNVVRLDELKAYGETFGYPQKYERNKFMDKFLEHRENVRNMLSSNLLFYDFKEGWELLCNFLNKNIPDCDVPLLNKDKIGDSYAIDISIEEKS